MKSQRWLRVKLLLKLAVINFPTSYLAWRIIKSSLLSSIPTNSLWNLVVMSWICQIKFRKKVLNKTWQIVLWSVQVNETREPWGIVMLQPIWVTFYNSIFACANSSITHLGSGRLFGFSYYLLLLLIHAMMLLWRNLQKKCFFMVFFSLECSKMITDFIKYLLKEDCYTLSL